MPSFQFRVVREHLYAALRTPILLQTYKYLLTLHKIAHSIYHTIPISIQHLHTTIKNLVTYTPFMTPFFRTPSAISLEKGQSNKRPLDPLSFRSPQSHSPQLLPANKDHPCPLFHLLQHSLCIFVPAYPHGQQAYNGA